MGENKMMRRAGLMLFVSAVSFLASLSCTDANEKYPIEHVVVLMQENRSFDHMLGYLARSLPIDGLTGNEYNLYNTTDPDGQRVKVSPTGYDTGPDDPCHSFECITEQIYGYNKPVSAKGEPKMNGFVQNALGVGHTPDNPLRMFDSAAVPIITTLAKEGALFDHWFCSVPGPTYPNRQYVHSATSHGATDNAVPKEGYPQDIIFDRLRDNGQTWKMYYEDSLAWAIFLGKLRAEENKPFLQHMDEFLIDAESGNLPNYSFIEPRISSNSYGLANSQHPDASVQEGERLIKLVYETLRKSPQWNSTLFVLTYDEHGGFYDHVAPPQEGIPNPDGIKGKNGFDFDRLGIRIPTILISPWIDHSIVSKPPDDMKPQPTSQYDLASIPATVKKIFGLKEFLTKRDAWSATFDHLLTTRTEPRTDLPMTLPDIPPPTLAQIQHEEEMPINDKQQDALKVMCQINDLPEDCWSSLENQREVSPFMAKLWQRWMDPTVVEEATE